MEPGPPIYDGPMTLAEACAELVALWEGILSIPRRGRPSRVDAFRPHDGRHWRRRDGADPPFGRERLGGRGRV
jgi:hypothetical protein